MEEEYKPNKPKLNEPAGRKIKQNHSLKTSLTFSRTYSFCFQSSPSTVKTLARKDFFFSPEV